MSVDTREGRIAALTQKFQSTFGWLSEAQTMRLLSLGQTELDKLLKEIPSTLRGAGDDPLVIGDVTRIVLGGQTFEAVPFTRTQDEKINMLEVMNRIALANPDCGGEKAGQALLALADGLPDELEHCRLLFPHWRVSEQEHHRLNALLCIQGMWQVNPWSDVYHQFGGSDRVVRLIP